MAYHSASPHLAKPCPLSSPRSSHVAPSIYPAASTAQAVPPPLTPYSSPSSSSTRGSFLWTARSGPRRNAAARGSRSSPELARAAAARSSEGASGRRGSKACHGPSRLDSTHPATPADIPAAIPAAALVQRIVDALCAHAAVAKRHAAATLTDGGAGNRLLRGAIGALAAAAVALAGMQLVVPSAAVAAEDDGGESRITIMLPMSPVKEVTRVQRTLVETWGIVREAFVDPTFNHQDWEERLQTAVSDSFKAGNAEEAYDSIRSMLASLDDPFTRIVTPKEYESFRISSDGALEGVGLLLATEPDTGRLVVLAPLEGGPADRAGIQPGDELLEINHAELGNINPQEAASLLRGEAGTAVTIKLRREVALDERSDMIQSEVPTVVTEVELQRESISLSPVFATMLPHTTDDGRDVATGYIRLAAFSQNAAEDMQKAVEKLERQGASSYILDLRNNPGGLVKAGLDVAQIWLDGASTLVNTVDRFGGVQRIMADERGMRHHALTGRPLVVLVNHGSASASEILAGALHDNGRAKLVGETTYGKGRIQSVFELSDGTALFVTVAKYLSPALHEIDRVGLAPDLSCAVPFADLEPTVPAPQQGTDSGGSTSGRARNRPGLTEDPRLRVSQPAVREASLPTAPPSSGQRSVDDDIVSSAMVASSSTSSPSLASPDARAAATPGGPSDLQFAAAAATSSRGSNGNSSTNTLLRELQNDLCIVTAERQLDALVD